MLSSRKTVRRSGRTLWCTILFFLVTVGFILWTGSVLNSIHHKRNKRLDDLKQRDTVSSLLKPIEKRNFSAANYRELPLATPSNQKTHRDISRWPPRDAVSPWPRSCPHLPPLHAPPDTPDGKPNQINDAEKVIRQRSTHLASWGEQSCSRWKLGGEWRPRDRKIFYATLVDSELDVLTVLLEEIYPVVDHIILQEAEMTWRYHPKKKYFETFKESHFANYTDKIRHVVYDFDQLKNASGGYCPGRDAEEAQKGTGMNSFDDRHRACPWFQQWYSRNNLANAAKDMRPQDIFIVADLDEIVAREFLVALKHCDVLEEILPKEAECKKMLILTFGHKYYFDCTHAKEAGHFHPDLTLGRCLPAFGPEELRLGWSDNTPSRPIFYKRVLGKEMPPLFKNPPGIAPAVVVGPAGWHMHSFASTAHVMYKTFTRAGLHMENWDEDLRATAFNRRSKCNERSSFFKFDAYGCQPLPHAVKENPQFWRHFIQYTPDEDIPDEFGSLERVLRLLESKKINKTSSSSSAVNRNRFFNI